MWSRSEDDPAGLVELKEIEAVFVRMASVWRVVIDGRAIGTTGEHPFYAENRGWVATQELTPEDRVLGEDGRWLRVEEAIDTGDWQTVYNFTVADHHTYFVGDDGWGVWVHNYGAQKLASAMKRQGQYGDEGTVPHHIVARGSYRGNVDLARSQAIMSKHGLNLDSAVNGVALPSTSKGSSARGYKHESVHTNDYHKHVADRLVLADRALGKAGVMRELRKIAGELSQGTFNPLPNRIINT